jgi:hypothetical protein
MLHRRGLQAETRERGPLLEELRRLGASSAPMGVYSWETPAGKRDVKQHQDYLNAIKGSMDALLEKVDAYYEMDDVHFFGDIKKSFHGINKKIEKNFYWYSEKEKTVENALVEFETILDMIIEARRSVDEYLIIWGHTNDNGIRGQVNTCLIEIRKYIIYIQGFVRN